MQFQFTPTVIVAGLALIAIAILRPKIIKFIKSLGRPRPLPYQEKPDFFSAAEISFYHCLRTAIGTERIIFAKVRLIDLMELPATTDGYTTWFNRVKAKHVDFVLCDAGTVKPILVIELDDSTHARQDRRNRDAFVDAALQAARLPILHVQAKRSYSTAELRQTIDETISAAAAARSASLRLSMTAAD